MRRSRSIGAARRRKTAKFAGNVKQTVKIMANKCFQITVGGETFIYSSEQMTRYLPPPNAQIKEIDCPAKQTTQKQQNNTLLLLLAGVAVLFLLGKK